MHSPRNYAFTLIELSIVIVIIGLLVGGITGGREMMKQQELRKVGTDARDYMFAMNQFKDKYGSLAGDFTGATAIWGRADGVAGTGDCDPTYQLTAGNSMNVGGKTCNGFGTGNLNSFFDNYLVWAHLSVAKFIVGNYTGNRGAFPYYDKPGITVPAGPYENTGYVWNAFPYGTLNSTNGVIVTPMPDGSTNDLFDGVYTYSLWYMLNYKVPMTGGWQMLQPALTPAQMKNVDSKFDDAMPATGSIRSLKKDPSFSWANCATSATITATYNVGYTGAAACPAIFMSTYGSQKANSL